MKVAFTCEKCGYEFGSPPAYMMWHDFMATPCPNCSKLTCGPITEEMVAEALFVAGHQWARDRADAGEPILDACDPYLQGRRMDMARFVLRLLYEMERARVYAGHPWQIDHERDWLLDLARET